MVRVKRFDIYVGKNYYGKAFAENLEEACEKVQHHPKLQGNWPVTVTEAEETTMEDRIRELYEMNFDTFEDFNAAVMELMAAEENND